MLLPHPLTTTIALPDWIKDVPLADVYRSHEELMALAIELSRLNTEHATGGPFGTVVAERLSPSEFRIVSLGVNRVVDQDCSLLHGEPVAIEYAQREVRKTFDLSGWDHWLYTNAEPCASCKMCFWWAGLRGIVYGASCSQVEARTRFDEGPPLREWIGWYKKHPTVPCEIIGELMADEACVVLQKWGEKNIPYNAGNGVAIKGH